MSLRVWLPLTKDIKNYGASDTVVTNDGATVDTAGKIGSCYAFNNQHIIIDSADIQNIFSSTT